MMAEVGCKAGTYCDVPAALLLCLCCCSGGTIVFDSSSASLNVAEPNIAKYSMLSVLYVMNQAWQLMLSTSVNSDYLEQQLHLAAHA
jgi:hypothetical protein